MLLSCCGKVGGVSRGLLLLLGITQGLFQLALPACLDCIQLLFQLCPLCAPLGPFLLMRLQPAVMLTHLVCRALVSVQQSEGSKLQSDP